MRANKTELHLSHNVLLTLSIKILLYIIDSSGVSTEEAGALFGAMLTWQMKDKSALNKFYISSLIDCLAHPSTFFFILFFLKQINSSESKHFHCNNVPRSNALLLDSFSIRKSEAGSLVLSRIHTAVSCLYVKT